MLERAFRIGISTSLVEESRQLGGGIVIQGDESKLERVIENLLENARKFTSAGGWIRVTATEDEANAYAVVEVAITVEGIV